MRKFFLKVGNYEEIITGVAASSFFASTLFLFGPSKVYFTNSSEFYFLYIEALPVLLALTLSAAVLLTLFSSLFKNALNKRVVSLIFAISFLLWLQGNIFVWNIGTFDGREVNWNAVPQGYMILDSAVWIIAILFALIRSSFVYAFVKKASVFFIVVQIIALFLSVVRAPEEPDFKRYFFDETKKFSFSSSSNVIIFVLDMFQTDVFQEIIDEDPRYKDTFDGFTYFRNSLGGFPTTYGSVTFLLTGQQYDNSKPFYKFVKDAFTSGSSIPAILRKNGCKVQVYEFPHVIHVDENIEDNVRRRKMKIATSLECKGLFDINLFDVVLFRYTPLVIKERIQQSWAKRALYKADDRNFLKALTSNIRVDTDSPVFKYFHLGGAHIPFTFNEKLESEKLPSNRTGYKRQARGALEIMRRILDALKTKGIFDKSMIFVIGDHGFPWQNVGVRLAKGMAYADVDAALKIPQHVIGSGIPLVLVKPLGSSGAMKVSDSPISLSDIPKTIFSALDLKNGANGYPMFEVKESEDRNRRFLNYDNSFDGTYFGKLEEYEVSGFSWAESSWKKTRRAFTKDGVEDSNQPTYRYGGEIRFGVNGNALEYQGGGWDIPQEKTTWAEGKKASLSLPVEAAASDLELKVSLLHFLNNGKNPQEVDVFINGRRAGGWKVVSSGEYRLTVPKELIPGNKADILFSFPDAISPKKLGINNDSRILSVGFNSLMLGKRPTYRYGGEIRFGVNGNALEYQGGGWDIPQEKTTWAEGKKASLSLPVEAAASDLELKVSLLHFLNNGKNPQEVDVFINGRRAGGWKVVSSGEYRLTVPKELIPGNKADILFSFPDAISPKKLGINNDSRILSVGLNSLMLKKRERDI